MSYTFSEYQAKQVEVAERLDELKSRLDNADSRVNNATEYRDGAAAPFKQLVADALSQKVVTPEYLRAIGFTVPSQWKKMSDVEQIAPQGDDLVEYITQLTATFNEALEEQRSADTELVDATEARDTVYGEYQALLIEAVETNLFSEGALEGWGHKVAPKRLRKQYRSHQVNTSDAHTSDNLVASEPTDTDNSYDHYNEF